ncbi:DNA-directed RNA polymerase specialized sigma subunit [Geomicrobium halophilum]|uniref:DNA-directed RNA polymerase specialized sigma subunit n=1 Tax=Geomicrobium halophilum TaxID=549000 RepID=A0A841PYW6_9BACL|nr:DNA-directed RNA polymerase specialized sigma subunit [Geomicrobium halophilum]
MNHHPLARQPFTFNEIYQQYTPLVLGMLKKLNIHSNHQEFIQAGYLGLWIAYKHHDDEKDRFHPMLSFVSEVKC